MKFEKTVFAPTLTEISKIFTKLQDDLLYLEDEVALQEIDRMTTDVKKVIITFVEGQQYTLKRIRANF